MKELNKNTAEVPQKGVWFVDVILWNKICKTVDAWRRGACPYCGYEPLKVGHCQIHGDYGERDYLKVIAEAVSKISKVKYPLAAVKQIKQKDIADYLIELCDPINVESVLDVGCGNKGIVAQDYWENKRHISKGYALDIFTIKPLPDVWNPILDDALNLRRYFKPKSVDVVTACGFLEHLSERDAIKFLKLAEEVARKLVYLTASTQLRDASKKVKRDGNIHHYYRSAWNNEKFEKLGYETNIKDFYNGVWMLAPFEIAAWKKLEGYYENQA